MPLLRRLAGVAVALACLWSAAAPAAETVRVGVLKYGTVNWEISIIQRHEMDVQHGFPLEVLELASDQATAVALQAGEVDIIVRSEEHTSELQSLMRISYAVFCL